jgi:TolB-like protein
MPLVSARTEARHEGYFRREWRLAVERTLDMADDHTFLLPIVIDDTDQAGARVPEKFLTVQWLRLPGGQPTAAFEALCRRLVTGQATGPQPPKKASIQPARAAGSKAPTREFPEFPREEAGQKVRFWAHVGGWTLQSAWIGFQRLPKWIRIILYLWVFVVLLSRGCVSSDDRHEKISPATTRKLKEISDNYQGGTNKADIAKLGTIISREFADQTGGTHKQSPLLAIPFNAPPEDPADQKLADSIFAFVYGRVSISRHGRVGLAEEALPSLDPAAAVERGRENHSTYVLYGGIERGSAGQVFNVKIVSVADGSVMWSASYPAAGADPAKIAAEIDSKVPTLEDEE